MEPLFQAEVTPVCVSLEPLTDLQTEPASLQLQITAICPLGGSAPVMGGPAPFLGGSAPQQQHASHRAAAVTGPRSQAGRCGVSAEEHCDVWVFCSL